MVADLPGVGPVAKQKDRLRFRGVTRQNGKRQQQQGQKIPDSDFHDGFFPWIDLQMSV